MSPVKKRPRQWLLLAHVVLSLGWMGAGAANVVLAATAAATPDGQLRRACYLLIDQIDFALVIPLAFSALASGLIISFATKWRLLRHWWVLVKLVLTVTVIVFSTFGVGVWVEQSITATGNDPFSSSPVAGRLIVGAGLNILAFVFMSWVSITKPWPKTPWTPAGRRDLSPTTTRNTTKV